MPFCGVLPESASLPAPARVIVFGATGWIGSATLTALRRLGADCVAATRPAVDLLDPPSLDRALAGATTIVHAASYTGSDPARCDLVNRVGTLNLLDAAARHDIGSVVYVSTTGVYGMGPHRALGEDDITPAPETPISASRLAADIAVREFGGTAVRTAFCYGDGDRWFYPGLRHILNRLGAHVDEGDALVSVIEIRDLAAVLAALAVDPAPGVFHAAEPAPITVRAAAAAAGCGPLPTMPASSAESTQRLTARELDLIARDHWYSAAAIWHTTNCTPAHSFPL